VPLEHILGRESREAVDAINRLQKLRHVYLPRFPPWNVLLAYICPVLNHCPKLSLPTLDHESFSYRDGLDVKKLCWFK
jgi:hypothetical protein